MPISSRHDFFVQWHLTERCNLNCTHCYQTGARVDELTHVEIREALAEIVEMLQAWSRAGQLEFSPALNVTGGEPLLRRDLTAILEEMTSLGFDVYLLTNGTLIDARFAGVLAELGIQGIQVSLEGPEKIHDSIRGEGSFTAACRGISHLSAAGHLVTVNTTLSAINIEHFKELIEITASLGAHKLGFSRLVPSGRGAGLVGRMIDSRKVREAYEEIFAQTVDTIEIVTGDPIAVQMKAANSPEDAGDIAAGGCSAGISGLTILADGTVVPCRRIPIPLGNVRHDALREIWAGSDILEGLRDRRRYRGKCGRCPRWAVCRGCRAIAHAASGFGGKADFLADDPQCFLTNESEQNQMSETLPAE